MSYVQFDDRRVYFAKNEFYDEKKFLSDLAKSERELG
jgi:hypothetical protein